MPDGVEVEDPITPGKPPEGAKILPRQREAVCAKCEMFHGICFEVFSELRACADPQELRLAWMAYAATLASRCPRGRWGHDQSREGTEPRGQQGASNRQSNWTPDQPSRGLGSTIAKITSSLGITPCGGPKQWQAALIGPAPYGSSAHACRSHQRDATGD